MPTKDQFAGVQYADRHWDQIMRFKGEEFFIAYLTRTMAFYGAATSPDHVLKVLDAVRTGVMTLSIMQKTSSEAKPQ